MKFFTFNKNYLSTRELSSFKFMTVTLILVLLYQTFHSFVPERIMLLWDFVIIMFGISGCLLFLRTHRLSGMPRFFLVLIPYFLFVGFLYEGSLLSGNNLSIILEQDIRYVLLCLMGCIFAYSSSMMTSFHFLMKWLSMISIVFGFLGLLNYNFVAEVVMGREGSWTMSYYYWWASASCFSYWGYYALFMKRDKWLGIVVLITYFVLGALFVKRVSVVNVIVLLIVYLLFNKANKISTAIKVVLIAILAVMTVYLITPGLFSTIKDSYSLRFEQAVDTANLDRNEEAFAYLENSTITHKIFGNGIGHYPRIVGYRDYNYQLNALHIGWANILFKGGVLYALFYVILLFKVFHKVKSRNHLNPYQLVCLGVSISSFVSLLYEGSWTYTLEPVCIFAPMFYLLSENKDEII